MAPTRTDDELVQLSKRLLHDVQVFFHVSRRLVRAAIFRESTPWEIEMALIESFALHARALVDFAFTRRRNDTRFPDDAYAIDFFNSPGEWHRLMPEQSVWLSAIRLRARKGTNVNIDRFGEQLGHLNYVVPPVSDYASGWPLVQVSRDLGAVLRTFIDAVPDARVIPVFKMKARRELPAVSRLRDPLQAMALWTPPAKTRPLT